MDAKHSRFGRLKIIKTGKVQLTFIDGCLVNLSPFRDTFREGAWLIFSWERVGSYSYKEIYSSSGGELPLL